MARLLQLLALYAICLIAMVSAAPMFAMKGAGMKVIAQNKLVKNIHTDTPVYRKGGKNDVIGGAVRDKDWNIQNGLVHPDPNKGLSTTRHEPEAKKKEVIHSIKSSEVKGDFTINHDGSDVKPGSKLPDGHSTIAYTGHSPVTPEELKSKVNALGWKKHDKKA